MKFGLDDATVASIVAVLRRYPGVERAVIYGSRAKGTYRPGSDIDLTLQGHTLTHEMRSRIASELDELLLPYTIDLSVFDTLDHEALRDHIVRVGQILYERIQPSQP